MFSIRILENKVHKRPKEIIAIFERAPCAVDTLRHVALIRRDRHSARISIKHAIERVMKFLDGLTDVNSFEDEY